MDILYHVSDTLNVDSSDVARVPPRYPSEHFTVSYTLRTPGSAPSSSSRIFTRSTVGDVKTQQEGLGAEISRLIPEIASQIDGFTVGRTYGIGLGDHNSCVSWWRTGTKSEVFGKGTESRQAEANGIHLRLVNTASFLVVD